MSAILATFIQIVKTNTLKGENRNSVITPYRLSKFVAFTAAKTLVFRASPVIGIDRGWLYVESCKSIWRRGREIKITHSSVHLNTVIQNPFIYTETQKRRQYTVVSKRAKDYSKTTGLPENVSDSVLLFGTVVRGRPWHKKSNYYDMSVFENISICKINCIYIVGFGKII